MFKKSIMTLVIAAIANASMGVAASAGRLKLEHRDNHHFITTDTPAHYTDACIYFDKKYLACLDLRVH